jgi:protein-L-isoaspartate(D-aspartate) O-methyltransferase
MAARQDRRRAGMLRAISRDAQDTGELTGRKAFSPEVVDALDRVPRHEFVPRAEFDFAYDNRPLAIGHGQTISQPFIVALMTDLLDLKQGATVLEIGTGCGYQAAVLAELAEQVYTIEIVEPLARDAAERLQRLGYANVEVRAGDGYNGWPEHAPYDGIIVTAAPPTIPPPLLDQLRPGGRLVVPVGKPDRPQDLMVIRKNTDGSLQRADILPVAFVPLTGNRRSTSAR